VLVPGSVGQDPIDAAGLDVIGWNDLGKLEARLAKGDVAGVIMEPAMCNQGAIQAAPGYLEGAKAACARHGAILIFDEVITGFRLGRSGAQARFGVTPDMSLVAKAVANGFPVAALVGRADLLDMFVTGGVLHGGTFNAQPVTMAAMVATQQALTPEGYESTSKRGVRLRDGIRDILKSTGVKAQALLKRGVRVLERGAWFVSFAHDDAVIDTTLAAVKEAAKEIA
jgi:glutamate-1-semialdehyde 2,1-aminomutase